jgi:hypothetical protein
MGVYVCVCACVATDGWTFHSKGIWLELGAVEEGVSVSVVGSSNYGE